MSKLSQSLKALIASAAARPSTVPAPSKILSIIQDIAKDAETRSVGRKAWITIAAATSMTMNCPQSLLAIQKVSTSDQNEDEAVETAEFIREIGLKCIAFNGIPRVINCLGDFRESLPTSIVQKLSRTQTRALDASNIQESNDRGQVLWKSIYHPFENKLIDKLAESHPNLPLQILRCNYGPLLSNPESNMPGDANAGRVLTTIIAISALRAQTGVGPQVMSHVFGLRKAYTDGSATAEGEETVEGGEWLASDEGSMWLLQTVDKLVEAIGQGQGTTFSPGIRAKL